MDDTTAAAETETATAPDRPEVAGHALELDPVAALELENDHLRRGILTRTVIGQAQGMLMAWFDISPDQAFEYLRRRSMADNRKLYDIAAELVRTGKRPTRPD